MSENGDETSKETSLNKEYSNLEVKFKETIGKIDRFLNDVAAVNSNLGSVEVDEDIEKLQDYRDFLDRAFLDFFRNNKKYISYQIVGKNFESFLDELQSSMKDHPLSFNGLNLSNVIVKTLDLLQAFDTIYTIAERENQANLLISNLRRQVATATESVKSVISAKEALESKSTEEIYSNAAKKYIKTARFYDFLLLVTLGIFYYITSNFFENFQMIAIFKAIQKSSPEAQTLAVFFFITKLTIVSIVITLATIFIRRSSHFRKLHDQANQTSLELNALPNYLRQVDSEHHSEIYKEMIPKFFGKELDQSQNDKVGDLVKDQLAAGTELIKASAEMVKNAKTLNENAELLKKTDKGSHNKVVSEG